MAAFGIGGEMVAWDAQNAERCKGVPFRAAISRRDALLAVSRNFKSVGALQAELTLLQNAV